MSSETPAAQQAVGETVLAADAEEKVAGSHFGIRVIVGVVRFVLQGAISMRAASRVSGINNHVAGRAPYEYPSHTTVQNLLLRVGLFLLQENQQRHDDWIWIADHTFSVGTLKVLVVLGIRWSNFTALRRPLELRDLSVLALIAVERSNGEVVAGQFRDLAEKAGTPLAILSDAGSDLNKGTALFQAAHDEVIALYDIVHCVSRKIEKLMNAQPLWDAFRTACCTCANAVRQTTLAHLKPPRPRTKARYMNIDREVRWAARALWILDRVRSGDLNDRQKQRLPLDSVEEKFGWLDAYHDSIKQWERLSLTGQEVIREVRRHGYGPETMAAVDDLAASRTDPLCRDFVNDVAAVARPMCEAAGRRRLPASSEVIESLFGKAKLLLSGTAAGTNNSLTAQLLAMVACTAEITPALVRAALARCRISDVRKWVKANFPTGLHYQRRADLRPTPEEKNLRKPRPAPIPNF